MTLSPDWGEGHTFFCYMENIIEVENLTHRYGKQIVYKDLSFTVKQGRIFGLLGKNGAGKTTLIKILMGFLRPISGTCLVLGQDSHKLSPETRRKIGLLFEGHLTYEFMTIAQVDKFYAPYYPAWNRDLYYGLIDKMDLPHNHKIAKMSCGQRSQVVLGLILAQSPELMILDDYSMGLDPGYRRLFLDYLTEYVKDGKKTVLVASHIVQDLEDLVDDVMIITGPGSILQASLPEFTAGFRLFQFEKKDQRPMPSNNGVITNVELKGNIVSVYSFEPKEIVEEHLMKNGFNPSSLMEVPMSLEDAFIGLTGKY